MICTHFNVTKVFRSKYEEPGRSGFLKSMLYLVMVLCIAAGSVTACPCHGAEYVVSSIGATASAPSITTFSPASGRVGAKIVITGSGFTGSTQVTFGGVSALAFKVNSNTRITAVVPVGAVTGVITVTNASGTGTSVKSFGVLPPLVSSFAPASGRVGRTVVINGTGLLGTAEVTFGDVRAASFTVKRNTRITAVVPAGAVTGSIKATTPSGTGTSAKSFRVLVPSITSFTPASGKTGTQVVIRGNNFSGATQVAFGGASALAYKVNNNTRITATVPLGSTTGPITVTTPSGTGTSAGSFSVLDPPAPSVGSFSPLSGRIGATFVIEGTHFTGTSRVTLGGVNVTTFTVENDGRISAVVPAGAVTGLITVTTVSGTSTSADPFTVIQPLPVPGLVLLEMVPPTPKRLLDNIAAYETHSFDGLFLRPAYSSYVFSHEAYQNSSYDGDRAALQALLSSRLTHNVLFFRATGVIGWDWFSDSDWAATESNVRIYAKMACDAQLKALAFDTEFYPYFDSNNNPINQTIWKYSAQPASATKDLIAMRAKVKQRGAQFMQAVQEECPGLPVMGLGLASFANDLGLQSESERVANWPTHKYGLLPAFTEGMATTSPPGGIIDGVEFTYDYIIPSYFDALDTIVKENVLSLMDTDATTYQQKVRIGSAVYVDGIMNLNTYASDAGFHYFGWWLDTDAQRLQILENNIYQGYRVSSTFHWIYSEKPNWVTGEALPTGIDDAILRSREKSMWGEPLGFENEVQALWDMVQSRKRAGHK